MFKKGLTKEGLPFTGENLDEFFPNIYVNDYIGDYTFAATLRALVSPRMEENQTLSVAIDDVNLMFTDLSCYPTEESKVKAVYSERNEVGVDHDFIAIVVLSSCAGENMRKNAQVMSAVDQCFIAQYPGFHELKDIRSFTAKNGNFRFFIDEDRHAAVVFISDATYAQLHLMQAFTSRILPWYFKDKPLDDIERALVKSLTGTSADEYIHILNSLEERSGLKLKSLEKQLKNFVINSKRKQLESVSRRIEDCNGFISGNIERYKKLINERALNILEKNGLEMQIREGVDSSEICDYFKHNKCVEFLTAQNSYIDFIVKCCIENFDVDMYERFSENFNTHIYEGYVVTNSDFNESKVRKEFLDAIFSEEPLLKIKTCAFYRVFMDGIVEVQSSYNYPKRFKDRIPNPHINRFACLGQHRPLIEEALRNGDCVGGVEQCVCSAKSINIGESPTVSQLMFDLFSTKQKKCIELPDGTSCTPSEALQWLRTGEK